MPQLVARCPRETVESFRTFAKNAGRTPSQALREMVAAVLHQTPPQDAGPTRAPRADCRSGSGPSGRLWLRLRPPELRRIRELADPAGQSAQAWVLGLIRERLGDAVPFAPADLAELRDAARALSAVGGNLNLVARELLRGHRYQSQAWQPERLADEVRAVRAEVRALIARAHTRTGDPDA